LVQYILDILKRPITALLGGVDVAKAMSINNLICDVIDYNNQHERYEPIKVNFNKNIHKSVTVRIHSEWFQEIFSTLLDNAIEAMQSRKKKQIDICSNESEGMIEITIQDFGCGISPQIQSKLFKKPTESEKGLGRGLLLANTIAQLYGGSIEIGNTCEDGTKMILKLPYETKSI
jgi:two-component system, NtrC family, sensor kinase